MGWRIVEAMANLTNRIAPLLQPGERIEAIVETHGEMGTISGPRMLADFATMHGLDPARAALGRDGGFIVLTDSRLVLFEDQFRPALVETASCPRDEARIWSWETTSVGATIRHLFVNLSSNAWAHQLVLTRQLYLRRGVAHDIDRLLAGVASEQGEPLPATRFES